MEATRLQAHAELCDEEEDEEEEVRIYVPARALNAKWQELGAELLYEVSVLCTSCMLRVVVLRVVVLRVVMLRVVVAADEWTWTRRNSVQCRQSSRPVPAAGSER